MSFSKAAFYFVAGALLVPCLSTVSVLRGSAWAQPAASEAQIKAAWEAIQADSAEREATDPQGAITRYQKFFEEAGYRSPAVGLQISLRIARIYQLDLKNPDKAIEIYDWALSLYKAQPDAITLQKGRLAAIEAQNRREGASGNTTPQGAIVPQPVGGGALGVNIAPPKGTGQLGVGVTPSANPGAIGANPFSIAQPNGELGINVPSPRTQKLSAINLPLPPGRALGWQPGPQRCVTALAQQSNGMLWVATEESGVWRYDPAAIQLKDKWTQFTVQDGLADESAYALAVDQKGRVWAGTLNHGVSVWNGKGWKNYGVLDGPLGERVFDIAICPTDGDVWIATNAGLARYSQQKDSWSYVTRADGLPSDQIQAIAFDKSGNIVLGTQCDGVALSQVADGYKTWRVVTGPEKMPLTATGEGLPSRLINDVLVARDGTIYAATTTGLAWSSDGGTKWAYVRGQDYADKVKGLYGGAPAGWKEGAGAVLAEDYISCLAQDEAGRFWIGHWNAGSEMLQMQGGPKGLGIKEVSYRKGSGFVKAMLPRAQGALLLARYDEGLSYGSAATEKNDIAPSAAVKPKVGVADLTVTLPVGAAAKAAIEPKAVAANTTAALPSAAVLPTAAKAPTLDELNAMLASLGKTKSLVPEKPTVTVLPDDWTTQGDWMGRYGTRYAWLCAMNAPLDHSIINDPSYDVKARLGPHPYQDGETYPAQGLRHWLHRKRWDDPRVLYNPIIGYRRQADIDDNGEVYPMTYEGPDVWVKVHVPKGTHRVSLYFFNKDGHDYSNRMRDYMVDVKRAHEDLEVVMQSPVLAKMRVRDFWGGVYKSFQIEGEGDYYFIVRRNNSFNAVMQALLIDKIDGPPTRYENRRDVWLGEVRYEAPAPQQQKEIEEAALQGCPSAGQSHIQAALDLWHALDETSGKMGGGAHGQAQQRLLAYRAVIAATGDTASGQELLSSWRRRLSLWTPSDRAEFESVMQQGFQSLHDNNPRLALRQ